MVLISKVCEHVLRDFSHFWMLRFCAVSRAFIVICKLQVFVNVLRDFIHFWMLQFCAVSHALLVICKRQVFVNVLRDFIHVWMLQFCAVRMEFRVTCKLCVHYRFEVFSDRFGFAHVLAIVTSGG